MDATIRKPYSAVKPVVTEGQLEKAALIAFLVFDCLNVTKKLVSDLERHWSLSPAEIEKFYARSVPSETHNIILSHECLARFGPSILLRSGLFYSFTRSGSVCTCSDWSNRCHCDGEAWRLDINPAYHNHGLILPISDPRFGFFTDLRIYRHGRDRHSFILKLGADQEIAA